VLGQRVGAGRVEVVQVCPMVAIVVRHSSGDHDDGGFDRSSGVPQWRMITSSLSVR
jgi:hypothetical protein